MSRNFTDLGIFFSFKPDRGISACLIGLLIILTQLACDNQQVPVAGRYDSGLFTDHCPLTTDFCLPEPPDVLKWRHE
jgi:hypothetical protein